MLQFRPLASSSDGCSYVLRAGDHPPLLIDAGIGFRDIQRALDFKVGSLAGVLISHAHGDHVKAVPELLRAGVDCYASSQTWATLRIESHRAKTVKEGDEFPVGPWNVHPFEAVHDTDGTLGFVIAGPDGGRLLYLTDSAYSKFRFDGLTHIAVEANYSRELLRQNTISGKINLQRGRRTTCTHLSLERLLDMLKANDLSQCEEIHLLHLSDENSNEEEFKLAVQRATGVPTYIAAKTEVLS
jgi:phosphoribosyl 1,2-cyclic phosphodiesterase